MFSRKFYDIFTTILFIFLVVTTFCVYYFFGGFFNNEYSSYTNDNVPLFNPFSLTLMPLQILLVIYYLFILILAFDLQEISLIGSEMVIATLILIPFSFILYLYSYRKFLN